MCYYKITARANAPKQNQNQTGARQPTNEEKAKDIMKTNINYTREVLGGYIMSDNTLNIQSLVDSVTVVADNDRKFYDRLKSNRTPIISLVKSAICMFVNAELKYNYGYIDYTCTWKQIEKYGHNIDGVIAELIDYYTEERKEAQN